MWGTSFLEYVFHEYIPDIQFKVGWDRLPDTTFNIHLVKIKLSQLLSKELFK